MDGSPQHFTGCHDYIRIVTEPVAQEKEEGEEIEMEISKTPQQPQRLVLESGTGNDCSNSC